MVFCLFFSVLLPEIVADELRTLLASALDPVGHQSQVGFNELMDLNLLRDTFLIAVMRGDQSAGKRLDVCSEKAEEQVFGFGGKKCSD